VFNPVPELIGEIKQQLQAWAHYFSIGYPRAAYWEIDWYIGKRLIQHLQRRSQRGFALIALSGCEAKRHP
jgi:hypothetical protein